MSTKDEDIRSLRELITYGLKGLSAYSKHANALLHDDENVDAFLQKALAATLDDSLGAEELVAWLWKSANMVWMAWLSSTKPTQKLMVIRKLLKSISASETTLPFSYPVMI